MTTPATDALDLYRQVVLEHSRHPRHSRRPEHYDAEAEGHNPLCGDKLRVYVSLANGRLADVSYEASACAICLASASLMSEAVRRQTPGEGELLISRFEQALGTDGSSLVGDLAALGGVSRYPSRVRCATLPWKTLQAALARLASPAGAAMPATVTTVTTE